MFYLKSLFEFVKLSKRSLVTFEFNQPIKVGCTSSFSFHNNDDHTDKMFIAWKKIVIHTY